MKLKLTKGLNLDLAGKVTDMTVTLAQGQLYAVIPDDFPGFTPKLEVKEGDTVLAGSPLLHDKNDERIKLVSPVAGTVESVVRGERRKIERVVIKAAEPGHSTQSGSNPTDSNDSKEGNGSKTGNDRKAGDANSVSFDTALPLARLLAQSGMLARMRQRPYDIIPTVDTLPRDIFVTGLDTAPLSVGFILPDDAPGMLQRAVKALQTLTAGKVYVSVPARGNINDIAGAEMVEIEGPHPSGNVGVQIANIAPVNKGEVVWTLDILTLYKIGVLLATGRVDTNTLVAVTGSEVVKPRLMSCREGIEIKALLKDDISTGSEHKRIISGNVLVGTKVSADGFLHFPYRQVTVIPEGDDVDEFMGWASLSPSKMSVSPTFPGHFFGHDFKPDARLHGGRRAMIMAGQYDKVLPMDIMLEYLLKAIIGGDIEAMEDLGIYEIAPEDAALAEYVDTSKLPVQHIIRQGLDNLSKELQ